MANLVIPSYYNQALKQTQRMLLGTDYVNHWLIPLDNTDIDSNVELYRATNGLTAKMRMSDMIPLPPEWSGLTIVNNKLKVDINALPSKQDGNKLVISNFDGLLYVNVREFIPADLAGSGLRVDANEKLYVYTPDLIWNDPTNLLKLNASNLFYVSSGDLADGTTIQVINNKLTVNTSTLISKDAGNMTSLGTDGGIFTTWNINANDQFLTVDNGSIRCYANLRYNTTSGKLEFLGKNDVIVASVDIPSGGSTFKSIVVEIDPTGQPAGTYLVITYETSSGDQVVYVDISTLIPIYVSGNTGIDITDRKISTRVDAAAGFSHNAAGITCASGYSLMTTVEKNKLISIEAGAQVNKVTSVNGRIGDVVVTKSDVGLSNVDNTSDMNKPVSTAQQVAIDLKQDKIVGSASTGVTDNFAVNRAMATNAAGKMWVAATTLTELDYLTGATSNIQVQLNSKQVSITGGATTIVTDNLAINRALISDGNGKVAVSGVTSTELGYVGGVTSSIQNQINGKQNTITGAATTITTVNLGPQRVAISDSNGKIAVSSITTTELSYLGGATSNIQAQIDATKTSVTNLTEVVNGLGGGWMPLYFDTAAGNVIQMIVPPDMSSVYLVSKDGNGAVTAYGVTIERTFDTTPAAVAVPTTEATALSLAAYINKDVTFRLTGSSGATKVAILLKMKGTI